METLNRMKACVAVLGFAVLVACGGETTSTPGRSATITIRAGASTTDTIGARSLQGLVVEVHQANGEPARNIEVLFSAPVERGMLIADVGASTYGSSARVTTNTNGQAVALVGFGGKPGPGAIIVAASTLNLTDTAHFTVMPGAAARVSIGGPPDSLLIAGKTAELTGGVFDRLGNIRNDVLTWTARGGFLSVNQQGAITGITPGRAYVRLSASVADGTLTDSVGVLVLPDLTVAWMRDPATRALNIGDLTGRVRKIVPQIGFSTAWEPGGTRAAAISIEGFLIVGDTAGNTTILGQTAVGTPSLPQWSADRQWIYYHGSIGPKIGIARIRTDGTTFEPIPTVGFARDASPAPDGRSVVYRSDAANLLEIRDLTTGITRLLPGTAAGSNPRWSPDGNWIAYRRDGIWLIRADGAFNELLLSANGVSWPEWSPDSKYIFTTSGHAYIIDVAARTSEPIPRLRAGSITVVRW